MNNDKALCAMTTGVVLAGGSSSRMGVNKAELSYQGMPLAQWQAEKLRGIGLTEVLISGYGAGMIPDDIPGKGPLGGCTALCEERPAGNVLCCRWTFR